jgi:hypothetical protein
VPAGTRALLISVSSASVYVTFDGSVPSATNGVTMPAGTLITVPTAAAPTVLAASGTPVFNAIPLK